MAIQKAQIKPFSKKYRAFFEASKTHRYNIQSGGYRAGKSVLSCYAFSYYLNNTRERLHIIAGATISTAKITLLDGNGYGLLSIWGNRAKIGKYENNEALYIQTDMGEKICLIVGHSKADSYKSIQGLSIGGILITEMGLCYTDAEDDTKDWVSMALSRLTASLDPKFIADMNPVAPSAYIYTHLDRMSRAVNAFGKSDYNYMQVSLFDNSALTDEQKQAYASLFAPDSVEYKRNVLGESASAEGLIYTSFNLTPENYIICNKDWAGFLKGHKGFVNIGVDYSLGGKSKTTFVASYLLDNFKTIFVIKSVAHDTRDKTTEFVREKFKEFLIDVQNKTNKGVRFVYCDYAQKILTADLRTVTKQIAPNVLVCDCVKGTINERIELKNSLLAQGRYFISEEAVTVIDATKTAQWDRKHPDTRLDDGTSDIDTLDAEEYSWSKFIKRLLLNNNK